MKFSDYWKPFFQRTSTLIYIGYVLVGLTLLLAVVGGVNLVNEHLRTEVAEGKIVSSRAEIIYNVDKWSAERNYNRSSVPKCAWDIEEDTYYVCDIYNTTCVSRDDNGMCTQEVNTTCLSGHYETDYDYNVMDWVDFTQFQIDYEDGYIEGIPEIFSNREKYEVSTRESYFVNIFSNTTTTLKVSKSEYLELTPSTVVRVKRRKRSKKVLKIL